MFLKEKSLTRESPYSNDMHHCDASQVLCIFVFYKLLDTQQKLWGYLVRQLAL